MASVLVQFWLAVHFLLVKLKNLGMKELTKIQLPKFSNVHVYRLHLPLGFIAH